MICMAVQRSIKMNKTKYVKKDRDLIPDIISPNMISIVRLCLIPVFILFFAIGFKHEGWKIASAIVFAIAGITDFIDGYIARKFNCVTTMGKFLDPIADKVLVSSALIMILSYYKLFNDTKYGAWLAITVGIFVAVIIARELIISGLREIAAEKHIVLAANMLGKAKTLVQDVAIFVIILSLDMLYYMAPTVGNVFFIIGYVFFCISVVLTIISGVWYLVENRKVFTED